MDTSSPEFIHEEPGPVQVEDLEVSDHGDWRLYVVILLFLVLLAGFIVQTLRYNGAEEASNHTEKARSCQSAYSAQFFFAQAGRDVPDAQLARENAKIQAANNKLIRGIILNSQNEGSGDTLIKQADEEAAKAVVHLEDIAKKFPDAISNYVKAARELKRVSNEAVNDRAAFNRSCDEIKGKN